MSNPADYEPPDDFGLEPMEGRVLTSGFLVTIQWQPGPVDDRGVPIPPMGGPEYFDTSFTTERPGRYFIKLKRKYPGAKALICAVPAELTDDEIEMLS